MQSCLGFPFDFSTQQAGFFQVPVWPQHKHFGGG